MTGWDHESARAGLEVIRRLRAHLDAAQAQLVAVLARSTGRDTRASLVRHLGLSARDAREAERVADVVGRVPGAADALAGAEVSAGHLSLLASMTDTEEAGSLLALAASQPVDRFATTVRRHLIERHAAGLRERQRHGRAVSFFPADDGNIGMRAILTPLDGERIKAMVNARCDANWRADHPERAEVLGGHGAEPRERRMADALVELLLGGESQPADGGGSEARTAGAGQAQGSRIGVVVVIEESTLTAHIAGSGAGSGPPSMPRTCSAPRSRRGPTCTPPCGRAAGRSCTSDAVAVTSVPSRSWPCWPATAARAGGRVAANPGPAVTPTTSGPGRTTERPTSRTCGCCAAATTPTATRPEARPTIPIRPRPDPGAAAVPTGPSSGRAADHPRPRPRQGDPEQVTPGR